MVIIDLVLLAITYVEPPAKLEGAVVQNRGVGFGITPPLSALTAAPWFAARLYVLGALHPARR